MQTVYGNRFVTADFSGSPVHYQSFTVPKLTKVKAISSWFVIYNSPVFTTFSMRIYANQNSLPTDLLYTLSKTFVLSDLLTTHPYGLKEVRFDNTLPIWLHADTTYHLVPWISGATLTAASHISWVKGYPDPNTTNSVPTRPDKIATLPYYMAMIGADE